MQRRDLIRFSLAATAAGALIPGAASALSSNPTCHPDNPLTGKMFYTKEAPGRWSGKEGSHAPNIELEQTSNGTSVKIVTGHGMGNFEHYIVKHILLDNITRKDGLMPERKKPTHDRGAKENTNKKLCG